MKNQLVARRSIVFPLHRGPLAAVGAAAIFGMLLGGCAYRRDTVAPAASPGGTVTTLPASRVVTYAEGRYELYGQGTSASPYYWVWIPYGSTPPPAPAPPAIQPR